MPSSPSHLHPEHAGPAPRLSVIVPLFNCLALTRAMLDSLRATLPGDVTHEIILVDDGSTDGTREWLGNSPEIQSAPFRVLLNERNLGFAGAASIGFRLSNAPPARASYAVRVGNLVRR